MQKLFEYAKKMYKNIMLVITNNVSDFFLVYKQ